MLTLNSESHAIEWQPFAAHQNKWVGRIDFEKLDYEEQQNFLNHSGMIRLVGKDSNYRHYDYIDTLKEYMYDSDQMVIIHTYKTPHLYPNDPETFLRISVKERCL